MLSLRFRDESWVLKLTAQMLTLCATKTAPFCCHDSPLKAHSSFVLLLQTQKAQQGPAAVWLEKNNRWVSHGVCKCNLVNTSAWGPNRLHVGFRLNNWTTDSKEQSVWAEEYKEGTRYEKMCIKKKSCRSLSNNLGSHQKVIPLLGPVVPQCWLLNPLVDNPSLKYWCSGNLTCS